MDNIEDIYELSPMQQGMLFHTLYSPQSGVYFEQQHCQLQGNINIQAFKQAWLHLMARHSVFRTAFYWEELEKPIQVVYDTVDLPWFEYDWTNFKEDEQKEKLETFLQVDRQQGFELNQAPLMRCILIKLASEKYQFIWSIHHLLIDGWCLPLVLKEVFSVYESLQQGKNISLPRTHPYRNYILWLQQQDISKAEIYWRKVLEGFIAPTSLVVDKIANKSSSEEEKYDSQSLKLSPDITSQLQLFAQQNRLTLNTLVQGAWAILLSRYNAEDDVVFGITVSGRPPSLPGVESMIGLFINTLPLRVKISEQIELIAWLQQLQKQQIEQEQYAYTPLVSIHQWSDIPPEMPLFESILVFENYPVDSFLTNSNYSLEISQFNIFEKTNYPLTLVATPGEQLNISISYNPDRFESDSITRMLGHLGTLLKSMVNNPQLPILQLPILTEAERHQLLIEWNNTEADFPANKCIHQLFETQVNHNSEAIAVVFQEQKLTYKELNQKANQLGYYLQKLGVKPESLVGICVERSLEMIVGILGILKAGGAYLPLDPSYPPERLAYMIKDAEVQILLTQNKLTEQLANISANLVLLDQHWDMITRESVVSLKTSVNPHNLAYVIYTSGSTGQPKGVMLEHQGLVNLTCWHQNSFQVTRLDKATQLAGTAFDASVWEIWPYLTAGASLELVPPELLSNPEQIRDWLIQQEITITFMPTPLAEALLSLDWTKNSSLRLMLTGGDKLSKTPSPSFPWQLVNNYGPTENTVVTTSGLVNAQTETQKSPSIGRPISNIQVYLLDHNLQPVPIGVSGELHIGGVGLARGYLHRPELTQEKFIPNPFAQLKSKRLYKTGDLARYLPDGKIEFLGRIDHQVKIRGFRIELGEIESLLVAYPYIREAVVIVEEDQPDHKRLIAYIVCQLDSTTTNKESQINPSHLRDYLSQKLPDYMIPSAFVSLESFPLTPNGKIDRRALSQLNKTSRNLGKNFIAPRDSLERELGQIWSEILGVYPIGVEDNFFELGGHSLLAVRLTAQISDKLGQKLPLATLFQNPTLETLANLLRSANNNLSWSSLVPIQAQGSQIPFFCVAGAGGNVIYYYDLARYLGLDQPFYGLQSVGLDGETEPLMRVEDMAAHYIKEIQTVQPQGPYRLGGHSFGGQVAFEMGQQLQKQGHQVDFIAIFDVYAPLAELKLQQLPENDTYWIIETAKMVAHWLDIEQPISEEILSNLTLDQQFEYFCKFLEKAHLLPSGNYLNLVKGLVKVYQTNCIAQRTYQPQNISPVPIILFRANDELEADIIRDEIKKQLHSSTLGWENFSSTSVDVHFIPSTHLKMMVAPNVKIIADILNTYLVSTTPTCYR